MKYAGVVFALASVVFADPSDAAASTNLTSIAAQELVWTSPSYGYSLTLPAGWVQIPQGELQRFRNERLPPQARRLIWDAAFQRGNPNDWFEWPYVIIQVIPTPLRGLPTEAQFSQLVQTLGNGRAVKRADVQEAIAAVPDATDRASVKSIATSFSSVYTDVRARRYWMLAKEAGQGIQVFMIGQFLENGTLIQINGYAEPAGFARTFSEFMAVSASLRTTKAP
jgi:hypothetical protein